MNVIPLPCYNVQNALNEALDYFEDKAHDAWKLGTLHLRQGYDVSGKALIEESIVLTRLLTAADEIERVTRARDEFFQKAADDFKLYRLHLARGAGWSAKQYLDEALEADAKAVSFANAVHAILNKRKEALKN